MGRTSDGKAGVGGVAGLGGEEGLMGPRDVGVGVRVGTAEARTRTHQGVRGSKELGLSGAGSSLLGSKGHEALWRGQDRYQVDGTE